MTKYCVTIKLQIMTIETNLSFLYFIYHMMQFHSGEITYWYGVAIVESKDRHVIFGTTNTTKNCSI